MNKKIFLTCLLPLCTQAATEDQNRFVFHTPSTSPQTAIITAAAGVSSALLSHYLFSLMIESGKTAHASVGMKTIVPVTDNVNVGLSTNVGFHLNEQVVEGLAVVTAAAIGTFAGWLAYSYQPEGYFRAARNNLAAVINDQIINELIETEENILQNIDSTYIASAHARIDAYNDFATHHVALKKASEWLSTAIKSSGDVELVDRAREYLPIIQDYMVQIAHCISIIKSDPDWYRQVKCYEMKKAREAQEELAAAIRLNGMDSRH